MILESPDCDFVTTTRLVNGKHPFLHIHWKKENDRAYIGKTRVWTDDSNTMMCEHIIEVGFNAPSSTLNFFFDSFSAGYWNYACLHSYGISFKDLQWVTVWAADSLKHLHHCRLKRGDNKCLAIKDEYTAKLDEHYAKLADAEKLAVLTDAIARCKGDPEEPRLVAYLNGIIHDLGLQQP